MTRPNGMFGDRDDYLFYSYRHEEDQLIDLLERFKYPVEKKAEDIAAFLGR